MKKVLLALILLFTLVSSSLADCTSTTYNLEVTTQGSGTIASPHFGVSCTSDCTYALNSGSTITLTATPDQSYNFAGWSADCDTVDGTACTVTMTGAKSPVASFFNGPVYTLTVTKSGTGTGTVTSSPSRIRCGNICAGPFASGTNVTLTATADPVCTFMGWSGACSGTGTCAITIGSNTSANASFADGCVGDPVKIGSTTYPTLDAAYAAASTGDTIKVQAPPLNQSLTANRDISVTLTGGYDCLFTSNSGRTTSLIGTIQTTAGGGTLTVSNIILTNQ